MLKRIIKYILLFIGTIVVFAIAAIAVFWWKYTTLVSSLPNDDYGRVKPGFYGKFVNTFVGTGGFPAWVCGHNFPGSTLPFGLVRLSPETAAIFTGIKGLNNSGYYFGDDKLLGFSHTRLAGTGAQDGGHILITPTSKSLKDIDFAEDYYHYFSHADETAFPGYYGIKLEEENIYCEMSSTLRSGIHRYTFADNCSNNLIFNITNALAGKRAEDGAVKIYPEKNEVSGSVKTFGSFAGRYGGIKIYFTARFNKVISDYIIWNGEECLKRLEEVKGDSLKLFLEFSSSNNDEPLIVMIGLSHVSEKNAEMNLHSETEGRLFNDIVNNAVNEWEKIFSLIKIEGCTDEQKYIFYSSLYRCFQMPTIFTDVNGEYVGFDKKIHKAENYNYFTDLSLWDTFRTIHPLYNLIAVNHQKDMINSLIKMAEQGGHLPRWPSGYGYTGSMLGSPADITIIESYLKGIRGFDADFAFRTMRENALNLISEGPLKSNRRSIEGYMKYNYCPADIKDRSVSRTMEYAWADYSISKLAGMLNKKADSILFSDRSKNYRNLWNPETKYFQARNSDGSFTQKFDPLQLTYTDWNDEYTKGYVEGSALQWRWAVPFDPEGLISLFNDREHFISELNKFFSLSDPKIAAWNPGSYYWHGNEPDIHAAYLFNSAGRPDLTQKWVRWILKNKYNNSYVGIDGNDDAGTLSAWYVFSSLGFYPVAGTELYQLGSPLFKRSELNLGSKKLVIVSDNYSPSNIYVEKVFLNNIELDRTWIKHSEIAEGGTLRFIMSDKPMMGEIENNYNKTGSD